MKRSFLLRSLAMTVLVGALACSHDTSDPDASLLHDARFRALVTEMNLPDYAVQRLEMYVGTLDATRMMAWHADGSASGILVSIDTEVGRALPLFVPAKYVERLRVILREAMRAP